MSGPRLQPGGGPAEHLIYTKGSVDFYSTYPGMYVPRPSACGRRG